MSKLDNAFETLVNLPEEDALTKNELVIYNRLLVFWYNLGFPRRMEIVWKVLADSELKTDISNARTVLRSLVGKGLVIREEGKSSRALPHYGIVMTKKPKVPKAQPTIEPEEVDMTAPRAYSNDVDVAILYLAKITGRAYSPETESHRKNLERWVKAGYTFKDFKKVMDNKAHEWLNNSMNKYLRPSTLFAPSHFEEYLAESDFEPVKEERQRNMRKGAR